MTDRKQHQKTATAAGGHGHLCAYARHASRIPASCADEHRKNGRNGQRMSDSTGRKQRLDTSSKDRSKPLSP